MQPNFLLIKELEGQYDQLVFMTTAAMEKKKKRHYLLSALGIDAAQSRCIVVVEDNYEYIINELNKQAFGNDDEYILNITGGTKVMSIALYEFFKDKKSSFYYVPIGKNEIMDLRAHTIRTLSYRLNLKEYLTLNSLHFECDNGFLLPPETAYATFEQFRKKRFYIPSKCKNAQALPMPEERRYYAGAWFEDYVYLRIKNDFNLHDGEIAKSVKIYRESSTTNDNEIDVAYVKDNMLSIIECKVSMIGNHSHPKDTVEEYLYKIAAVAKDLGMRVNSYLFTLHKMETFNELTLDNIHKRASILGIKQIVTSDALVKDRLKL